MGCVGSSPKKPQEGAKAPANQSAGQAGASEGKPVSGSAVKQVKLTQEQVTKKRQEMRTNLEEGHSKPPAVYIPHFEPISHIQE